MRRRSRLLAAGAIGLAGASVAWPVLALPALLAVVLAAVVLAGRARLAAALAGGLLALVGTARFAVRTMTPNLVGSGGRATEKAALSHLREILWAQDLVRQAPPRGNGRYATAEVLAGHAGAAIAPLQAHLYRALEPAGRPTMLERDGYLFLVWLPARGGGWTTSGPLVDPAGATRAWRAFAWPAALRDGSRRAYFIDQDDRICETTNPLGYEGAAKMPEPAALPDGASCEPDRDGSGWRAWRDKKPRPPRAD